MAINTTRLCQKLGKICGALNEVNTYRGTTVPARAATLYAQYASADPEAVEGVWDAADAAAGAEAGLVAYYRSLASAAIIGEVQLDRLLPAPTLDFAVPEWVRQMAIAGDTLQAAPLSFTGPTGVGSPTGDFTFVVTGKDGTGVASDLGLPDVYLIQVTADADHGATAWADVFSVVGKAATPDTADAAYPTGSGVNTSVTAVDPAAGTTLTTDPSFDDWSGNTPTNWTLVSGTTAGANFFKVADDPRDGSDGFAARFVGDGTNVLKVRQAVSVSANTVYVVYFRVKKVADPGTDWGVTVRLVNSTTGAAVSGSAVSSATAASVAANWTNVAAAEITTPTNLPDAVSLEVVFSQYNTPGTAAASGAEAYVDWVNLIAVAPLYTNGVSLVAFSGLTAGVLADTWTLTAALPGAVSGYLIRGIDRLINLNQFAVRIPTTGGTPTQANSLVS